MLRPRLRGILPCSERDRRIRCVRGVRLRPERGRSAGDRRRDAGHGSEALPPFRHPFANAEREWRCGNEWRPGVSYFLWLRTEGGSDGGHEPIPVIGLFAQTLAARGSEFVKLGAAVVFRCAPTGLEESLTHQA